MPSADPAATRGVGRGRHRAVTAAAAALGLAGTALVGIAVAQQVPEPPGGPPSPATASAPAVRPATPEALSPTTPAGPVGGPARPGRPAVEDPPAPAALAASRPVRVDIPALGVATDDVVDLGLDAQRVMEVPQGGAPIGWYTGSPTPGEPGPSVLAGHVTWNGERGVFFDLATLRPGDRIRVTRADGTTPTFRVRRVAQYAKDEFPTVEVYGNTPGPELRLITCAGDYVESQSRYLDNVVVYAELVDPAG